MLWQETFSSVQISLSATEEIASNLIKDIFVSPNHILHKLLFTPWDGN